MIEAGEPAPQFTLRDQDGKAVSLSDFRGRRVLLIFYPLDFSPACTDQLSIYQEVKAEVEGRGVEMVGISVDHPFAHRAFREKLGIEFPLLADFEPKGEVARSYGAYIDSVGHGNRSLVLIDEQGTVEWVHESATPLEVPGANLIFDALAQRASASP
jgi:peroxiredoxin